MFTNKEDCCFSDLNKKYYVFEFHFLFYLHIFFIP